MQSRRITPEYTLLLRYDILPGMHELCYRYMAGEFVTTMQENEIYMVSAWHVVYGEYPEWQVEFVSERLEIINTMLQTETWQKLETRLKTYTRNYSRRIVPYNSNFNL